MPKEFTLPKIEESISRLDQLFDMAFTEKHQLVKDWNQVKNQLQNSESIENFPDVAMRLDDLFCSAFETDHPAMQDWVNIRFELKG